MSDRNNAPCFRITEGKGFQMVFENGYEISVQFGPHNYCDVSSDNEVQEELRGCHQANTAEIAVFTPEGEFYRLGSCDDVVGWQPPDVIGKLIGLLATDDVAGIPENLERFKEEHQF